MTGRVRRFSKEPERREETIKNSPDVVRRSVAATIKGEKYAFAHPKEAGEILYKYHPEVSVDIGEGETKYPIS